MNKARKGLILNKKNYLVAVFQKWVKYRKNNEFENTLRRQMIQVFFFSSQQKYVFRTNFCSVSAGLQKR